MADEGNKGRSLDDREPRPGRCRDVEQPLLEDNDESLTEDDELTTADDESATADDEQTTADDEQTTADDEQTTADDELTAADDETSTADGETTTADGETTTADGETITADGETTTADDEPTTVDDESATGDYQSTNTADEESLTAEYEALSVDDSNTDDDSASSIPYKLVPGDYESTPEKRPPEIEDVSLHPTPSTSRDASSSTGTQDIPAQFEKQKREEIQTFGGKKRPGEESSEMMKEAKTQKVDTSIEGKNDAGKRTARSFEETLFSQVADFFGRQQYADSTQSSSSARSSDNVQYSDSVRSHDSPRSPEAEPSGVPRGDYLRKLLTSDSRKLQKSDSLGSSDTDYPDLQYSDSVRSHDSPRSPEAGPSSVPRGDYLRKLLTSDSRKLQKSDSLGSSDTDYPDLQYSDSVRSYDSPRSPEAGPSGVPRSEYLRKIQKSDSLGSSDSDYPDLSYASHYSPDSQKFRPSPEDEGFQGAVGEQAPEGALADQEHDSGDSLVSEGIYSIVTISSEENQPDRQMIRITGVLEDGRISFHYLSNDGQIEGEMRYFRLPIFNDETLDIYRRYLTSQPHKKFIMRVSMRRQIRPEIYENELETNINIPMFKEVALTLNNPPMLPEGNAPAVRAMVCGIEENSRRILYLNFDIKTTVFISYLLRIIMHTLKMGDLSPYRASRPYENDKLYVYYNPDRTKFGAYRIKLAENHANKANAYLDTSNRHRVEDQNRDRELRHLPRDVHNTRERIRETERQAEMEYDVFKEIDTGMEFWLDPERIFDLHQVCPELENVPEQATRVRVVSLDSNKDFQDDCLRLYYHNKSLVGVTRPEMQFEQDIPRVNIITIDPPPEIIAAASPDLPDEDLFFEPPQQGNPPQGNPPDGNPPDGNPPDVIPQDVNLPDENL